MVSKGAGTLAERPDRWDTVCDGALCRQKVYGLVAENARVLRADGTIPLPKLGPDTPLLDAIGIWDQPAGVWHVSDSLADRALVWELCQRMRLDMDAATRATLALPVSDETQAVSLRASATCGGRGYQVTGACWLALHERGLLADDMGLGKSKQMLDALPDDNGVLIIAPAVAKGVWLREIKKWAADRFDSVIVCTGWGSFRYPRTSRECVILNYDIVPPQRSELVNAIKLIKSIELERAQYLAGVSWADPEDKKWWASHMRLMKAWRALYRVRNQGAGTVVGRTLTSTRDILKRTPVVSKPRACPVTLIFDEVHKLKSNKALQTKRCRVLSRYAARCYGLTGTPLENDPFELWGVLTSIRAKPPHWCDRPDPNDPKKKVSGWFAFLNAFGAKRKVHGGFEFEADDDEAIIVKPGTTEILRRVMLRRTKAEVGGELPPVTYGEFPVDLTPALVARLDDLEPEIREYLLRDEVPDITKYSQLRKAIASSRIAAMLKFIESYEESGTPLLVFSAHVAPIEKLRKRKQWFAVTGDTSAVKRTEFEDAFQRGERLGFAGTIKSMGVAITLTRAAHVLFVDQAVTPSANRQAIKRADRIGQTASNVHVTIMYSDHPLDVAVSEMLVRKGKLFDRTLHGKYQPLFT